MSANGDGPPLTSGSRPDAQSAANTTTSVTPVHGAHPVASASLYEPVPGRGWVWLSIRCPYCSGVHLGRVRPGKSAGGKRKTTCGTVIVVVRRRYRAAQGGAV